LQPYLKNHQSVLVGQSGMGKSTIINALLPDQNVRTQMMSEALDSGKHTTTAAHLYHLDGPDFSKNSSLIDSPGLQEFGLNHLSQQDLELAFIEFRPYLGKCRFNNCKHTHEPDCAVLNAVQQGKISAQRQQFYQALTLELAQ
jgi:ribosome biogenesis GTPase / thiamine phosphate phosphatase